MSAPIDGPDRYIRFGWGFAAIDAVFVLMNVACMLLFGLNGWNAAAAFFCGFLGVRAYIDWREDVRRDVEHRALIARIRDARWDAL